MIGLVGNSNLLDYLDGWSNDTPPAERADRSEVTIKGIGEGPAELWAGGVMTLPVRITLAPENARTSAERCEDAVRGAPATSKSSE
eukprot:5899694-Pyramimonas_sp.AAC.1